MPELKTDEAVEKTRDDSVYVIKKSFVDIVYGTLAVGFITLYIISLIANKELEHSYYLGWVGIASFIYRTISNSSAKDGKQILTTAVAVLSIIAFIVVELHKMFH